jgi:putative ABC transport system substrate-binding protein
MRRREFIGLVGGVAVSWPLAARTQQPAMRAVGFLSGRSLATDKHLVVAFGRGLSEAGYVEGRDVTIDYNWAEGQIDRLPALATGLVRRQVSVIFAGGLDVKLRAVKDVISTIPVVFATGGDPVELGLVASMNQAWRQRHGSNCGDRCALVKTARTAAPPATVGNSCRTAGRSQQSNG